MTKHPNEEDKIQIVVENLLPIFHSHLFISYFLNFKALIRVETQIENAITSVKLRKRKISSGELGI